MKKHKLLKKKFWLKLLKRVTSDILAKKVRGIILVIAFGLIWRFLGLNAGLLWLLFLTFAVYDWDNRVIGVMALLCLAACPFLLSFKKDALAEQVAVYAYFFLVMTVVLQMIEYKRHPELFKESDYEKE